MQGVTFYGPGFLDSGGPTVPVAPPTEAPTGLDNVTNGFDPQGDGFREVEREQREGASEHE
jgi:hypothetical protein